MSREDELARRRRIRNRARARKIRRIKAIAMLILMLTLIIALIVGIAAIVKSVKGGNNPSASKPGQNNPGVEQQETEPEDTSRDFSAVQTDGKAVVSRFYYYGTHFNYDATLAFEPEADGVTVDRVTTRVYKITDVTLSSAVMEEKAKFDYRDNVLSVSASEYIDEGICLEQIQKGEYIFLIAVKDSLGNTYLYPMTDESGMDDLEYYTLTKDGSNRKIEIGAKTEKDDNNKELTTFVASCTNCTLPDDVYDIIIDPGHGSMDGGTEGVDTLLDKNGEKYNERTIVLEYAKQMKEELEAMGYKVALTRDGSEGTNTNDWCYWNCFNPGNRVPKVVDSKAKYCIPLHLNSAPGMTRTRGVEVYTSIKAGYRLGDLVVGEIEANTSMPASGKNGNDEAHPGVYKTHLSENPNADYLYMIRETAGIITGAMSEKNTQKNVNYGAEVCYMEMGYISDEDNLKIILNEQDKYTQAITDAIQTDINNLQAVADDEE